MRKAFLYIILFIFALMIVAVSSFVHVFTGAEDPTVGAKAYFGLPVPFKVCAPGWAWCSWNWWFLADLLILFFGLQYLLYRFHGPKNCHKNS